MYFVFLRLIYILFNMDQLFIVFKEFSVLEIKSLELGDIVSKVQSSANITNLEFGAELIISLIKIMKSIGPKTLPWGTPLSLSEGDELLEFIDTY